MKKMQEGIKEYISMRQALGFELEHVERRLFDFFSGSSELSVLFLEKCGHTCPF